MKLLARPIAKLEPRPMARITRLPSNSLLNFIEAAPNPILGEVSTDPEIAAHERIEGIKHGFYERAKKERALQDEVTRTDFYFVVCFQHGIQATAFLQSVGYPSVDDAYVDGMILADKMKIKLPASPIKLKPPRLPDKTLSRLVTGIKRRAASPLKPTDEGDADG